MKILSFRWPVVAEQLCVSLVLAASMSILAGCGVATSGPKAGPIVVATAGSSPSQSRSLVISTSVQLSMSPVGDNINAGVDWTLSCGGSPVTGAVTGGACGTLSPIHTPAGTATLFTAPGFVPLGSTVTVTATVTSAPSQSSTMVLTILPAPIVIDLSVASSVRVNGQVPVAAITANDTKYQGVTFSATCGSTVAGACGTFNPTAAVFGTTTYTGPANVPAGGTVTIKATSVTDPTKSASATIQILPSLASNPASPVSITVSPSSFYTQTVGATHITRLTAVITNDVTPGGGVDWAVTCGSALCGTISPTHTASGIAASYSSPAAVPTGGTVTITATSTADPTKSAVATGTVVTVAPIVVTISSAPPAKLTVSGTASLAATVTNDSKNLGVDWTATCGAALCGNFSPAHTASAGKTTYTAPAVVPAGSVVTITAASSATTPANPAVATTTIQSSVAFTQPPPNVLIVGATAILAATVVNDPGNLGLNWTATCGGAACGSFTPSSAHTSSGSTITYTAPSTVPAGSVVTITASSPATTPPNVASAGTTILVQPPSLTFAQPPPTNMSGGTSATISAVVANDVAPGGVLWSVQCGSTAAGACGAVVPHQTASGAPATYTAPPVTSPGTAVTIVATSAADNSVSLSSSPIAIVPNTTLSVSFIPAAPGQVQANSVVSLEAAVANDLTQAGVDWQVCASGCGFFTVKPATPGTTYPYTPPVPAVTATTVSGWPNGVPLPYTAPSQPPSSGIVTIALAAHVDPTVTSSASISISAGLAGTPLKGIVRAGAQPVVGASIALYAAGTSGYASAATALLAQGSAPITDSNGNFTVPAGYTCPQPTSQLYVVATGGYVGGNGPNSALALMTALGSCNSIGATPIVVNEITTVASVWPLAPFSANDEYGGNISYLYLGTSSSNQVGLANAFAAVNNLVDISTGQARFNVPAGNATVPYLEINTIADMLNACSATTGGAYGDGSPCGNLFSATNFTLQSLQTSIVPTDTLQVAFNIAQHPVTEYGYNTSLSILYSLVTPFSPFQPVLTTVPADLAISLNYTSGGGLSSASKVGSFAIDATGNVWITDSQANSVIEFNAVGTPVSPATGFPAGGSSIAIDASGDVWTSGNAGLVELTNLGAPYPGSPFAGVAGGGNDIAIDAQGNVWITNGTGVVEFNSLGLELSPAGGFINNGVFQTGSVAVDSTNRPWIINEVPGFGAQLAQLSNPGGQVIVNPLGAYLGVQLAPDASGNIWYSATSLIGLCKMSPVGVGGPSCTSGGSQGGLPELNAQGTALDGAGTIWISSAGGTQPFVGVISPNVMPFVPSLIGSSSPGAFVSSTLAVGPLRAAVDGSGNVWVLLANNTVTEYLGLAVPVVTPIALGVKNKKLAAKP